MKAISHSSYRPLRSSSYRAPRSTSNSNSSYRNQPVDSVQLSSAAQEKPGRGKRLAVFGAIGMAVGTAAAAVLFPAVTAGALLIGATIGGVSGAAIGDGALEPHEIIPSKKFDPYSFDDRMNPDFAYHPQNPNNPFFWDK